MLKMGCIQIPPFSSPKVLFWKLWVILGCFGRHVPTGTISTTEPLRGKRLLTIIEAIQSRVLKFC